MTTSLFGFNYEFDLDIFKIFCYCFFLGVYLRTLLILLFKQNWLKSSNHLLSFSFLPVVGFLITSVISSNIALSLGMVGALSIIRFRTPVKNPFELVTYFVLITIGWYINTFDFTPEKLMAVKYYNFFIRIINNRIYILFL